MVDHGVMSFLVGECIEGGFREPLSNVSSSLGPDDRVAALMDLRGAAITLLEDFAQKGRQHTALLQSFLAQISRSFLDLQRSMLFSPVPRLQTSAAQLFRMLLRLNI